ncbi:endonuclease/exonuclease/phosphatase family protein [Azoarcus sp. KH32C]|uniref:endonuclease/exonuclease/phosphatase family protein n=1 Tax=Azoarcus sp. KH32C TaxID=748247 RepID=UPI00023866EE|nr:endonuclease/exonuclease/phosphatase family protein [Azoarcus sp. KH32C]BAL23688.1 hypothetical protein AZKH_1366 [Azoarcus sp. KH32C]
MNVKRLDLNFLTRYRADGAMVGLLASVAGSLTAPLTAVLSDSTTRVAWLVDLAAHWQWLYLAVGVLCGAVLLWRRKHGWAIPALAALFVSGAWPGPRADTLSPSGTQTLTVVSANIHVGSSDTTPLLNWVESIHADVVVIQEVSPTVAPQLQRWDDFPFRIITPDESPFGLAILSRYPLLNTDSRETEVQPLHIRTHISWQGQTIALAGIHPMPPISPEHHFRRAQLLEAEAEWAAETELPSMVVGDFNATPWSSVMASLNATGLRRATGLAPTWPAALPLIPIDQVLVTADWYVSESGVGPSIGSDHRPVYARISKQSR